MSSPRSCAAGPTLTLGFPIGVLVLASPTLTTLQGNLLRSAVAAHTRVGSGNPLTGFLSSHHVAPHWVSAHHCPLILELHSDPVGELLLDL